MAINIKEIFESDLDPNSNVWWSIDKINKINYNFGQLTSGGMYGPQGRIGADGDFGVKGGVGLQGPIGPLGPQGPPGKSAINDWIYSIDNRDPLNSIEYLFPKKNINSTLEYFPVAMQVGISNTSSLYNIPAYFTDYSMLSNVNNNDIGSIKTNLRVQHDNSFADFRLQTASILNIGDIDLMSTSLELIHVSENTILKSITPQDQVPTNAHEIIDNLIKINQRVSAPGILEAVATFEENVNALDVFNYDNNAQTGNILIPTGITGDIVWTNKRNIIGSYPVGSIISIRLSDFNATNFHLDETISQSGPPYNQLRIIYGRGKVGTDYEGWYLCNGETWKDVFEENQFQTPNLTSFNYTIDSNGGGQPLLVNKGNNSPIIIGGSNISLGALSDDVGGYQVEMEVNSTDAVIDVGTTPINSYISRMIHIVLLNLPDLFWSNGDSTIADYASADYTSEYKT